MFNKMISHSIFMIYSFIATGIAHSSPCCEHAVFLQHMRNVHDSGWNHLLLPLSFHRSRLRCTRAAFYIQQSVRFCDYDILHSCVSVGFCDAAFAPIYYTLCTDLYSVWENEAFISGNFSWHHMASFLAIRR